MDVDALNALVTSAIWRAEQLDELGIRSAPLAWLEVSRVEEELGKALDVSTSEGRIARRGAVRAALKARDYSRAEALAQRYREENSTPDGLCRAIAEMLDDDARRLSERFPYATKRHPVSELRDLARRIHSSGAFGLAA